MVHLNRCHFVKLIRDSFHVYIFQVEMDLYSVYVSLCKGRVQSLLQDTGCSIEILGTVCCCYHVHFSSDYVPLICKDNDFCLLRWESNKTL